MRSLLGIFSKKGNKDQGDQQNLDNLFQDFNNPMPQNNGPFNQFQQSNNINPMANNYQNFSFGQTNQQMPLQQSTPSQFNQSWNLPPQPTPSPSQFPPPPQQQQIQSQPELGQGGFAIDERLEQYINNTINEILKDKLNEVHDELSQIKIWKEKVEYLINKMQEQIDKLDNRITEINNLATRKLEEYDKGMQEATTEIQALHRLIRTMIPAISESTKELRETVEELKSLRDSIRKP
jgi:tetrahydromethanopterin S-methyltransferase subunit B